MTSVPLLNWLCLGTICTLTACADKVVPPSGSTTPTTIIVSENTVTPGDQLIVESSNFSGLTKEEFTVYFDETAVAITAFDAKTTLTVPVPVLKEGVHALKVKRSGKDFASAKVNFRKTPCLQLLFSYTAGKIKLNKQTASTGMFRQYDGLGARVLSFDVQDMNNNLLATGTVAHPLQDPEVFKENGTIERGKADPNKAAAFDIRIPNFTPPFKVIIYDTKDEVVTAATFKNRKKIYEETIN